MTTPKPIESLDWILQTHDEKIKQASKKWDGYPVSKSRKELKQALEAYITERERLAKIDTLNYIEQFAQTENFVDWDFIANMLDQLETIEN